MDILLVAATPFEIAPILVYLEGSYKKHEDGTFENKDTWVHPLITGVGMAATAWYLGRYFALNRPNWALNAGIAGAFNRTLNLGDVVQLGTDRFGDLGVEEADGRFTDLFDLKLMMPDEPPFQGGILKNPIADQAAFLPLMHGITVNRVHGSTYSIESIQKKYPGVDVETMESAAFFHACLTAEVPFISLRSISNYVEPRNRDSWNIQLAIEHLNEVVIAMLQTVSDGVV